ncbi:MAG: succinate dehydrogenase [Phycisphaerae bacterium]
MSTPQPGFIDRNYFLLRRLHSLTGIVPVGVFLINHLLTNSLAVLNSKEGGAKFDEEVFWIHSLPYLVFIEWGLIILPLLYHAGFGIVIALTGKSNTRHYQYADNVRYTLQRWTGWIALVFIIAHLAHFRFGHLFGGLEYVGTTAPFDQMKQGFTDSVLPMAAWLVIYAVGLIATVFHFANGITTFCITWGITVNDSSRKKVSMLSVGVGALLLLWGFLALYAIATVEPHQTLDMTPSEEHVAVVPDRG